MKDEGGSEAAERPTFAVSSLHGGFAAAVQPVTAQAIATSAEGLIAGEVQVPASGGTLPAYRARPASGGKRAAILVVSEIWGAHEYIRDVARRLARLGYYAIVPELFARHGDAGAVADVQALIRDIVSKASDAEVLADLDAAASFARAEHPEIRKLGVTGFCWGGRITWMYAAHHPGVDAAVAWYGPVARSYHVGDATALDVAQRIRAPVLALYGGDDPGIPNDTVEAMLAKLKSAGNTGSELVLYPDTPHAFHADYRPSYRKAQAEDGWKRALAWFRRHLDDAL